MGLTPRDILNLFQEQTHQHDLKFDAPFLQEPYSSRNLYLYIICKQTHLSLIFYIVGYSLMIFLELMCAQNAYSLQARMLQDLIFHHKYILHLALISCADCIDFRVEMHAAKINRD